MIPFTPATHDGGSFDVYAIPFVPDFLLKINQARPRQIIGGLGSAFNVDFDKYLRSFAGTTFLSDLQLPSDQQNPRQPRGLTVKPDRDISTFRKWVQFWLAAEHRSFDAPQSSYDDYKVQIMFARSDHAADLILTATITVPGIAENSPTVKLGDVVELRPLWLDHSHNPLYLVENYARGYLANQIYLPGWCGDAIHAEISKINRVEETVQISLTFERKIFESVQNQLNTPQFNVSFPRSQSWQGSLSRAIRTVYSLKEGGWFEKMLFPEPAYAKQQIKLNSAHFHFNAVDKHLNYEQLRAVDSVVKQNYGTVPFMIQGPPGTGKTKTIVEIGLQLLSTAGLSHILICAPSDPAADTIADRLKASLGPGEMIRLNSPARTFAEVPDGLLPYCYVDGDHFDLPPFPKMMNYKVVVTSCQDADLLVQARLTNEALFKFKVAMFSALHEKNHVPKIQHHWQAVLIDEAAQAIEAEIMIPLTVVAPLSPETEELKSPVVVMAGDQHQLGPRTTSLDPIIRTSLFERLLDRPLYADHPLARHRLRPGATAVRSLTKAMLPIIRPPFAVLLRNYRSHPAILSVPNALFYSDTLLPEAEDIDSMIDWDGWKGSWPVLFSQNSGPDEIERDGGGWYNLSEIEVAYNYASSLLASDLVAQKDICVMSPFSSQVRRLRVKFRSMGLYNVNIGPVEAFQGLESRIVILCTTRSRRRFLDQDKERGFGIINERRRFNVAITRAKHGLVVIGTQDVLSIDPCWRAFLDFCIRNDLYYGNINAQAAAFARQAPMPILERTLKQKASQAGPSLLGITGELDDDMWIRGVTENLPDHDDESDEDDVEDDRTEDGHLDPDFDTDDEKAIEE